MCNSVNCSHGDDNLNDSLDGLFEGPAQPLTPSTVPFETKGNLIDAPTRAVVETRAAAHGHRYEEKCPKCRGTGRFVGYTGRVLGDCFECKGKGIKTFKSSPEAREKARDAAAAKRDAAAQAARDSAAKWAEENTADWAWMVAAAPRFEFAKAMADAVLKYGSLTEKQHAAVTRLRLQSEVRQAQWAAERAERESVKAEINVDKLAAAFATAKANKLKYPKIRLADFVFSLAPDHGRNAGAIYVKDGETYLGKVVEGRFTRSRDCNAELEQAIIAAAADPEAAAAAYGLQTGTCSCCGRELTNAESVGLGIGPICREKFGW